MEYLKENDLGSASHWTFVGKGAANLVYRIRIRYPTPEPSELEEYGDGTPPPTEVEPEGKPSANELAVFESRSHLPFGLVSSGRY